ncbi:MAG: protein-L-isoaspartate(D-aspartate) O-methyltransferase [Desulfofustis sp.]|nr:protein-L-isoaspartate(D-aspartate) O-methyltransferase [Desulfofustis sp.]RZW26615.1 MAG: protein-L-isoaspartate(D-aspartate) O-methyltransferase [Desulfobulbaceae bacterium]MBT8347746.1 protein-L-isoaspartate(D-aspartate) O-methyltransferase [Desulfofustis sp.]MBT8355316.1 protein-L-isoaspartate(D-aspartate) O-methyltransferase [Desulfofustis sp.]NNF47228.1 protein-L-isoaspartate(D-aspartate) O-methyltransferase [Desulfofustis sp.]
MVQEQLIPRGISDPQVIEAMRAVPRHCFVDDALQSRAYGDFPLPISAGQTISQPYIVALMTEALKLTGSERVLEVGTGSGYQAAILSRLCSQVYTVERINLLLAGARRVFDQLRYFNIVAKLDDGTLGWPEHGPYDAIIVTAGGPDVPEPLIDQLEEGGRLVIPVGDQHLQVLQLLEKKEDEVQIKELEKVRFVDLVGEHGWK